MIVNENGHRYKADKKWNHLLNQPYDYEDSGLLRRLISHKIWQTKNPILKSILNYVEKSCVGWLKYVDVLANYKNYLWRNR